MRIIEGKNVGKLNVKCINCNRYYNYDELLKRDNSKPLNGADWRTMDDLIPRAATLERMKSMAGCATCDNYNYVRCRACTWDDAMNIVEEMSEVNVVQVIRCWDCKNWETDWKPNHSVDGEHFCPMISLVTSGEWFCAYGERSDSE